MKPSIFIGSSSEALPLARAIKNELSSEFHAEIWDERLFELGENTLNNLLLFVQCYDFAILVLTGDDFTKSRKQNAKSPRDNVIFELGLFMGAIGRRHAFPIIAPTENRRLKVPTDLLGNTALTLPKGFARKCDRKALKKELQQLLDTLRQRSRESTLQHLPSTALAIGYFQNFMLPVCRELASKKKIPIKGKQVDISNGNFDFTVVLPRSLSEASIEGAKKFCRNNNVIEFELRTGARHYPFYVTTSFKSGQLHFFDYPTTLRSSHECVRLALAGPFLGYGKYHSILDEREIRNFERTLRILLDEASATEFRENVKIIHTS
jgi:hypothetical protein